MPPHQSPMSLLRKHQPTLNLSAVFETAQKDPTSHQRLMKKMVSLYNGLDNKTPFIAEFLQCLTCCLPIMEKHPTVERALDFAAKYCIHHDRVADQGEVLLLSVYEYLFQNHSRKHQGIRYRVCEFINRLLNGMGEQASLDDDIFQSIASCMLDRLQDRTPTIRSQAVMALQRLQEPLESGCPIIKAFIFHMEADPSSEVRAKVIASIAVTTKTVPYILARLNDVKDTVRKETYRTLSRLKIQRFSIRQRLDIFRRGLNDKSELVRNYVKNHLLPVWFKNNVDSNYVEFLKLLDIEMYEKEVGIILTSLFKREPIHNVLELIKQIEGPNKLVVVESLTPEVAFLWRTIVNYLNEPPPDIKGIDEDIVFTILPELTHFAKYMSEFASTLPSEDGRKEVFVLLQLLEIASVYSLSDEAGREQLRVLCIKLLTDDKVTAKLVPTIAKLFQGIVPDVKNRISTMAEIISDIREPLHVSVPSPPGSPAADTPMEEDGEEPHTSKNEIEDADSGMRNDSVTLIKCLTIVIEFLKAKDVHKMDGTLHSIHEHFIKNCFQVQDTAVICLAQDALALLCIMSVDLAKQSFLNFCIQLSDDATSVSALEAVFDIILMHGFEAVASSLTCPPEDSFQSDYYTFSDDETFNNPTLRYFISLLTTLLSSNCQQVKDTAVLGLSKLLLSGKLSSHTVLSRLILTWFSPSSAEEPFTRQALGIFFKVYSSKKINAGGVIVKALIPTVKIIQEAEYEDPISQIEPMNVIKLLTTLVRHDILVPSDISNGSYHCRLAFICLREILSGKCQASVLIKALSLLNFEDCDNVHLRDLCLLTEKAVRKVIKSGDKKSVKLIQEFFMKCKSNLNIHTLKNSDEIEEEDTSSVKDANNTAAESVLSGISRLSVSPSKGDSDSAVERVLPSDSEDSPPPDSSSPTTPPFKVPFSVKEPENVSSSCVSNPAPLETSDFSMVIENEVTSPKRKAEVTPPAQDLDSSSSSFAETPIPAKRRNTKKKPSSESINSSLRMSTRSASKKKKK